MSHVTFEQLRPALTQAHERLDDALEGGIYDNYVQGANTVDPILHMPDCRGLLLDHSVEVDPESLARLASPDANSFQKGAAGQELGFRVYSHLPAKDCAMPTLLEATIASYTSQVISDSDAPLRLLCSFNTLEHRISHAPDEPVIFTRLEKGIERTIEKDDNNLWRAVSVARTAGQEQKTAAGYQPANLDELMQLNAAKAQEFIARATVLVLGTAALIEGLRKRP